MNAILLVTAMSARQLLGQRRILFPVLLTLVPVILAVIERAGTGDSAAAGAADVLGPWVAAALLPLTTLILATSALGSEIEDGTAVYLLAKPIPRWRILAGKLLAAWGAAAVIVIAAAAVSGAIVLAGESGWNVLGGFVVALLAGTLAYSAIFLMLSLLTSRALLAGLAYVFVWEWIMTGIAPGVQRASIGEYTLGIAKLVSGAPASVIDDAELGGVLSLILMAVVSAVAVAVAARRLARFQLSGEA